MWRSRRRSAALDPATRADMQKLVRTLWEETGTTILFVTHNIAEALYPGTRVVPKMRRWAGGWKPRWLSSRGELTGSRA